MNSRNRIGLSFVFDNSSNSGIVNYLISIVQGFNRLPPSVQPTLVIFYSANAPISQVTSIFYPHIEFFKIPDDLPHLRFVQHKINGLANRLFKKTVYKREVPSKIVQSVFPVFPFDNFYGRIKRKIHWLVDFNAYYFPSHYADNGNWFKNWHSEISKTTDKVVVSSLESLKDFQRFYPEAKNSVNVLRFVSFADELPLVPESELREKYNISARFFMTPNQFWEHKNHIIVLKSLVELKERGIDIKVVFTGSPVANRGLGFVYDQLLLYVNEHDLSDDVIFLGVIDRIDQVNLMRTADAIIQPSKFEGWSTLVEECKALNKAIIISDIPVHREQTDTNCIFFNADSYDSLADAIEHFLNHSSPISKINYDSNRDHFAQELKQLFS